MKKTGEILKKNLGLDKFRYVKIARALVSSYKILFVWYDSRRPNVPLTTHRIRKFPWTTMIFSGTDLLRGTDRGTMFAPPITIEDFNGMIRGALIITVDMIGNNLIDTRAFTKKFKDSKIVPIKIKFNLDEYTISDLRSNAPNPHEKQFLKTRQTKGEQGTFLTGLSWNDRNKRAIGKEKNTSTLTLTFNVRPTYKGSQGNYTQKGTQTGTKKNYQVKIQFQNINDWVESRQAFLGLTKGEQIEFIHGIIKDADVKIWSDDPSWIYQGNYENAVELDYSLYSWPSNVPKAKGRWAKIKTGSTTTPYFSLSKHMIETLTIIPFIADQIAKMIREKYENK